MMENLLDYDRARIISRPTNGRTAIVRSQVIEFDPQGIEFLADLFPVPFEQLWEYLTAAAWPAKFRGGGSRR